MRTKMNHDNNEAELRKKACELNKKSGDFYYVGVPTTDPHALEKYNALQRKRYEEDKKKRGREVVELIRKANDGDPESQYEIATHYDGGGYTDVSLGYKPKKAFYYYKLAADQGHAMAQEQVAGRYFRGDNEGTKGLWIRDNGTRRDRKKAFYYYKLLADQGNSTGQYQVGKCYFYANGVDRDPKKALHYYTLALDKLDKEVFFKNLFHSYDPEWDAKNGWMVGSIVGKSTSDLRILKKMKEIFNKKTKGEQK